MVGDAVTHRSHYRANAIHAVDQKVSQRSSVPRAGSDLRNHLADKVSSSRWDSKTPSPILYMQCNGEPLGEGQIQRKMLNLWQPFSCLMLLSNN